MATWPLRTDHCENSQMGVGGEWMEVDQKEYGKWGKGNKETAAAQNQMKSSLENVSS